jgi:hypothetical protein
VVETHDAFEGKIRSEDTLPTEVLNMPFVNPQSDRSLWRERRRAMHWQ